MRVKLVPPLDAGETQKTNVHEYRAGEPRVAYADSDDGSDRAAGEGFNLRLAAMSLRGGWKDSPVVFVGGQVTAAAAQKVTGFTEELQGLLSVSVAHEEGARIRPRA